MRRLKIIQILPTLNTGGVERGVLDFNKYLVSRGHDSYVISNGGRQVKNLINDGAKLGVSSRGLGSLEQKNGAQYVKGDFQLATAADIVADPSAPEAFVEGIMEGVEWVYENNILKAVEVEKMREELRTAKLNKLEEVKLNVWKKFVENL